MQPYHSPLESKTESPAAVTVDEDDAVYVLWEDKTLSVYTADGTNTHRYVPLTFLWGLHDKVKWAITVTKDKSIIIAKRNYLKRETTIMVYLCNKDGELTSSFDTGLKTEDHVVKSLSVTCDGEIMILTENNYISSFTLHIFTEDGQRQKFMKVRHGENDVFIRDIFYDKVSKNIITLSSDDKKVLIEYWSVETGELQSSHSLLLTTVPDDVLWFRFIGGTYGALALVGPQQVISLKNSL